MDGALGGPALQSAARSRFPPILQGAGPPGPPGTEGVGFEQNLGAAVPFDLELVGEDGKAVTLRAIADGHPLVLALVYFRCPMLCTEVLNGLVRSLRAVSLDAGPDFRVACLSIDPSEKPDLASAKKANYLDAYGRKAPEEAWRCLVAGEPAIRQIADVVGFRYRYDVRTGTYAHAAGIVVLTPGGVVSRYLFGVDYAPRDLQLALVESASNRIGGLADRLLLLCFHYDPARGKYGIAIFRLLRVAGLATVGAIAAAVFWMSRRKGRPSPRPSPSG